MSQKMKAKALKTAAMLCALALGATGCAGGDAQQSATEDGARAPELRVGTVIDVGTWTAADASWGNAAIYQMAVYDTLLRTEADGTVVPGLAEQWEYDDSQTTLTLELRDGVTFSDGTEFTAQIAAENLERFKSGASENVGNLAGIESIDVVDEDTLLIDLHAPDPAFLTYLSQNSGLQAAPSSFEAADSQVKPVGSGPYVLEAEESVVGSRYVFTAREDYWDQAVQHYERITMSLYPDATAMLNALKGGQVDFANLNSTSQIPDAEAAGYTINATPVNWKGFILADRNGQTEAAVGDVRVRQAINYALDRDALMNAIEGGHGEATTQIFGPKTEAYKEELEDAYPYDPQKARELLTEAGYPDGVTLVQPQTSFVPASDYELIAGMLAESNITIKYEQVGSSFIGDLLGGKWATFQFGLNQDPVAWMSYQLSVAPESAWNVKHVADQAVQDLATRMRMGGADGVAAAQELNQYLVDEAWFAPIYRVMGVLVTAEGTNVTAKEGQAMPNLWDIVPAS